MPGPTKRNSSAPSPLRAFDPHAVAHYEVENYVAYYRRRWPALLWLSIGLVRAAFGVSLPRAMQGAYLVARAEIAAAPFPDNDIPTAERYMTRFYTLLKRAYPHEPFDPAIAARLDVRWWVVHRQLFAEADNLPLVDALADLWAYVYREPRERMLPAATLRAEAMLISDRWVRAGCDLHSAALIEEKAVMEQAYIALRRVVQGAPSLTVAG